MAVLSYKANGNIAPCRFVKLDTTADGRVLQCGAGDKIQGISQAGTRRTPYSTLDDGYAAIAGEDLEVFGTAEQPLLELGGTVTRGDRLKADANGAGVTSSTDKDEWGAIALQSGVSGQLVRVEVHPNNQASV